MSMNGDLVFVPCELTGQIAGLPKIGPKPLRHPTIGGLCPLCNITFKMEDFTTLLPLGPGGDAMERFKCKQGEPYMGFAMEVHYACATGDTGLAIPGAPPLATPSVDPDNPPSRIILP